MPEQLGERNIFSKFRTHPGGNGMWLGDGVWMDDLGAHALRGDMIWGHKLPPLVE